MKNLISISIAAVLWLLLTTGCTTTQQITHWPDGTSTTNAVKQLDPQKTASAIRFIIPSAVTIAVAHEPSAREYIAKAQVAICFAASAGQTSPDQLKAAVNATGVREIQTPEAQTAITAVYGIYEAYYGDVIAQKLDQNQWLIPVLRAICDGLTEGLANAPVPPPVVKPEPAIITPAVLTPITSP